MTGVTDERSFVEEARRAKLPALKALGVQPFAYRFDRTHTSAQALTAYDDSMGESGPEVSVAGRLVSHRGQGKTSFGHIEDSAGRIQLYFRQDLLGQGYDLVKLLDLGDHIGVKGILFRTKAGEVTVRALEVTLLAKSLRPLPLGKSRSDEEGTTTYGGLNDAEVRYRSGTPISRCIRGA
jgi:lysyl-tRNA synthetase class 2